MLETLAANQAERIAEAAERARTAREAYARRELAEINAALRRTQGRVTAEIRKLEDAVASSNQALRLKRLTEVKAQVDRITADLKKDLTAFAPDSAEGAMLLGLRDGAIGLGVQIPAYEALSLNEADNLASTVFGLVDRAAVDFVTRYRLDLMGDVSVALNREIKLRVASGIVSGQSIPNIVRDLGQVIDDPEAFRTAGNTVFKSAQLRLTTIARSETNRAHNQGRLKFYDAVGIRQVRWLADSDPCPVCRGLNGKVFDLDKTPGIPAHPNCECTLVAAGAARACDFSPGRTAAGLRPALILLRTFADTTSGPTATTPAPVDAQGACVLTPEQVTAYAAEEAAKEVDLSAYKDDIKAGNYGALPASAVRALAKKRGLSVHRSKLEFVKMLDLSEPGVDHSALAGKQLLEKIEQFGIPKVRSKQELVKLLTDLDAAEAAVVQKAAETAPNFAAMSVPQLQEEAKKAGISIAKNKTQFIKELEAAEPNPSIPHFALKGSDLDFKIKQHHISKLKGKQQLIEELQKAFSVGGDVAEAAEAALKHRAELQAAIDAVSVPDSAAGWQDFLVAYKKAAAFAEAKGPFIPKAEFGTMAASLQTKKAAWDAKISGMTTTELKALAKETKLPHWQWYNKPEFITKLTSIDAEELAKVDASVETKWQAWKTAQKAPKSQPVGALKVEAPPVVPETPLPPKDPTKLVAADAPFNEVDTAWRERVTAGRFGNRKSGSELGGAHRKYLYTDADGNGWLFKPADEAFRGHADEVAYKVGRLIDPDAIEVRTIRLDGELGSIQRLRTDLAAKKDFSGMSPVELTAAELEQVEREHVIDWLLGNHDAHSENFLRGKNGHVFGIDKGQMFKHLGEDELAVDYHPNRKYGAGEPFYNTIMRAYAEKKIDFVPQVTLKYIRRVEAISEDEYRRILSPYFEHRFSDPTKREAFLQMALARKRTLRADFERYYDGLARKRGLKGFAFDGIAAPPGTRLGEFETKLIDDAAAARWQGKSLPVDEDQIEDQNALVFEQLVRKAGKDVGRQTVVSLKVRPEHEDKVLDVVRKHLVAGAKSIPKVGEALAEDEFYDTILTAVKSFNFHTKDKVFNSPKFDAALNLRARLKVLEKHADPEIRAMAGEYLSTLNQMEEAITKAKAGAEPTALPKFGQYVRKTEPKVERRTKAEFTVREVGVRLQRRENKGGELVWDGSTHTIDQAFGRSFGKGVQYEVDFDDGVTAVYRPWKQNSGVYAIAGEMEIRVDQGLGPEAVEKALAKLERLGLNASTAAIEDAEIMYLKKQAYVLGIDASPRYKAVLAKAGGQDKQSQVRMLREFWNAELGIPDVTKKAGYDPFGTFQHATRGGEGAGRRLQLRFDLSDADLDRELPNHALFHNLTNNSDVASFVELSLENNGAMISTAEKLRLGIKPGGMSPGADMGTGGASYFFTRIRKRPSAANPGNVGLYFKKRLLRRMDAITYESDLFGRVTEDTVRSYRRADPKQWKKIADRTHSDETIFKYTVTLVDNIDVIVTKNAAERARVIGAFKKNGQAVLPDGRKIEDVVLSSR